MSSVEDRIRELVGSGKISPDEAKELLMATATAPKPTLAQVFLQPFERFGGGTSALFGLGLGLAALAMYNWPIRFSGYIDYYVVEHAPGFRKAAFEQVAAWPIPAVVCWIVLRVMRRPVRFVDALGAIGLARAPYVLAAPILVALTPLEGHPIRTNVVLALALPVLAWMFTWTFQGFRHVSGLRGTRLVVTFLVFVMLAEVASRAFLQLST